MTPDWKQNPSRSDGMGSQKPPDAAPAEGPVVPGSQFDAADVVVTWDDDSDSLDAPAPSTVPAIKSLYPVTPGSSPATTTDLGDAAHALYRQGPPEPPPDDPDSDPPTAEVLPDARAQLIPEDMPTPPAPISPLPTPMELAAQPMPPSAPNTPQPPRQDFFPIPDEVPDIPPEDTEEVRQPAYQRRARRPQRRGPMALIFNAFVWFLMTGFFLAVIVGILYFRHGYDRLNSPRPERTRIVVFTVNSGDRFADIVRKMEEANLLTTEMGLPDRHLMWLLTRIEGNSEKIQAGVYRLNEGMSLREIYSRLIQGSRDFKITVPEGRHVRGVAAIVKRRVESFDADRFVDLTRNADFIASLGMDLTSLEGYLYPSTYFFGPGMSEEELVRMMVKSFRETVEPAVRNLETTDSLSLHERVIMASLIEREARSDEDRPLIASVLFNRLKQGMPLQVDATVQYAIGGYNRPPRPEDMKVDSPYNTYQHKGLPPGPICSPRLESILATYKAPPTEYLFYVHKGDGTHAFSKTFDEHREYVRLYLKAPAAAIAGDAATMPSAAPANNTRKQVAPE